MIGKDYKKQGEIAEGAFLLECLKKGFTISKPYGDSSKYDFIIDNGKKLFRVQVKSVGTKDTGKYQNRYRCNASFGNHKAENKYTKNEIDVFACYILPLNLWYFVPVHNVSGKYIDLYPNYKSSGKYENFKNNWKFSKT